MQFFVNVLISALVKRFNASQMHDIFFIIMQLFSNLLKVLKSTQKYIKWDKVYKIIPTAANICWIMLKYAEVYQCTQKYAEVYILLGKIIQFYAKYTEFAKA